MPRHLVDHVVATFEMEYLASLSVCLVYDPRTGEIYSLRFMSVVAFYLTGVFVFVAVVGDFSV